MSHIHDQPRLRPRRAKRALESEHGPGVGFYVTVGFVVGVVLGLASWVATAVGR